MSLKGYLSPLIHTVEKATAWGIFKGSDSDEPVVSPSESLLVPSSFPDFEY